MKKNSRIFITALIVLWLLTSVFIYFFHFVNASSCNLKQGCLKLGSHLWQIKLIDSHRYYFEAFKTSVGLNSDKSYVLNPVIYVIIGLLFLYLANFFYEKFIQKEKQFVLKLSPFLIFLLFTFIFGFVYERWLNFYNLETPIKYQSIFLRYPLLVAQLSAVVLLSISFGKNIIGRFFGKILNLENILAEFLLSFAFGVMPIIFLLFALAFFKLLIFKYVLTFLIIILFFSIREVYFWLKIFFKRHIIIQTNYLDPSIFLFLLILIFAANNFLELIRPLPIGFDDLTAYQNNSHIMAQGGKLLSGAISYYWELFVSLGPVIFKSVNIGLLISFLGSIFSLLAFYFVSKTYFLYKDFIEEKARKSAMLAAAIFYTLPMTVFQSSKDMKVDLISFFFTLMALYLCWQWKVGFLKIKKDNFKLLYMAAFLVGFASAIKYTSLFFLIILVIYAVWIVFKKYQFKFNKYFFLIWFLLLAILPILPITVRNIYQTRSLSLASVRFGKPVLEGFKIDPPFNANAGIENNFLKYMKNQSTGVQEELGRYTGYDQWYKKYLLLPLRVIRNPVITGGYIDIGFLFLAIIPLAYLLFKRTKPKKSNNWYQEIAILALTYFLFWLFLASGVIWYGLSGFIFLILLMIEVVDTVKLYFGRFLYYFLLSYIFIWFICATIIRTTFLPGYNLIIDPIGLKYARGEINEQTYIDDKFQPYFGIIGIINQDIEKNPQNPPIIYRVGTFYKYMIIRNNKTVLDDQMLDRFAFAYQDKDNEKMMARFKNSGIKYLLIDRNLMNIDYTPDKTLLSKGNDFLNFLKENQDNLQLLTNPTDDRVMIFKII